VMKQRLVDVADTARSSLERAASLAHHPTAKAVPAAMQTSYGNWNEPSVMRHTRNPILPPQRRTPWLAHQQRKPRTF
jgi:hypothetical protein